MEEEQKENKNKEEKVSKAVEKVEAEKNKTEIQKQEKSETKKEIKEETKKDKKKDIKAIVKKDKAIVRGNDLHISTKHSMAICKFIKGKKTQEAIKDLEQVVKLKKVVPMKGEIPHRHGKGIMSGRYPKNASLVFIKLLKTLEGNARVNGLGENPKITLASPSIASRPYGRFGAYRKKRTNIILEARIK